MKYLDQVQGVASGPRDLTRLEAALNELEGALMDAKIRRDAANDEVEEALKRIAFLANPQQVNVPMPAFR